MNIAGYDLLGNQGSEGIRYAWEMGSGTRYVESAAFKNKTKGEESDICGYTTSVSAGCLLSAQRTQCAFCATGNDLPFSRLLTSKEIALQNVFMVLSDLERSDHLELQTKMREFAYMGQGEPGLSYQQVRDAIEITNSAMEQLGQKVYRHVFATCGIPESIEQYKQDIQYFFTQRVTLHLSVHALSERDRLMPINRIYPIEDVVNVAKEVKEISGEKPCIGVMLFRNFSKHGLIEDYTTNKNEFKAILAMIDPSLFRISLCEYNPIKNLDSADEYPTEQMMELVAIARRYGFETKYFTSYGREKDTACGMLGGKEPECVASAKWKRLEEKAKKMVNLF